MNMTARRKFIKRLKARGYSFKDIINLILIEEKNKGIKYLQQGQKVKLDIVKIKNDPSWTSLTDTYRNWIETHSEEEFTVEYDKNHEVNPMIVCLKEDTTIPKWLLWEGHLQLV